MIESKLTRIRFKDFVLGKRQTTRYLFKNKQNNNYPEITKPLVGRRNDIVVHNVQCVQKTRCRLMTEENQARFNGVYNRCGRCRYIVTIVV